MNVRYNSIKDFDIQQGDGVNVSLWFQGCEHKCEGCFSPHTWDFNKGELFTQDTIDYIINLLTKDKINKNLSILGGETLSANKLDMLQSLLEQVRATVPNIKIFLWTGYLWEDVKSLPLVKYLDVIVDGKYNKSEHNPTRYKGSNNQRVIDVIKSLQANKVILYK